MASTDTVEASRRYFEKLDRFLTSSVLESPPDVVRRARLFLISVALIVLVILLSIIVHLLDGNYERAAFLLGPLFIVGSTPLIFRFTTSPEFAAYVLCGLTTVFSLVSLHVRSDGLMSPVGVIGLPLVASVLGGKRAGVVWTVISTFLLGVYAYWVPAGDPNRALSWLITIVCAATAAGCVTIETWRHRAIEAAEEARLRAEGEVEKRRQTEAALRQSQRLFSSAFRYAPSMMVLAEIQTGVVLDVNEAFLEWSGLKASDSKGLSVSQLGPAFGQGDQERFFAMLEGAGAGEDFEFSFRRSDGSEVWLLARAEQIEIDGTGCVLLQGVDISTRKHAEELLLKSSDELRLRFDERGERLEQQDRLSTLGSLAAGIAHQVNNPIGCIMAATQLALLAADDIDRAEVQQKALVTALNEAKRCGQIVNNTMKFARNEPTEKWPNDIVAIVERACSIVRPEVVGRGGKLEIMQGDFKCLPVHLSPIDIEQAVVNLVRNAGESREMDVHVGVEIRRLEDEVSIAVTDNGPGIDPAVRSKLFEPLTTSKLGMGGSGLGLFVAHRIVVDHGGSIRATSRAGSGAQLEIRLPLAESILG